MFLYLGLRDCQGPVAISWGLGGGGAGLRPSLPPMQCKWGEEHCHFLQTMGGHTVPSPPAQLPNLNTQPTVSEILGRETRPATEPFCSLITVLLRDKGKEEVFPHLLKEANPF